MSAESLGTGSATAGDADPTAPPSGGGVIPPFFQLPRNQQPGFLYSLLPELYRYTDQDVGRGALEALLQVIEQPYLQLQGNMDDLYRDWFVATCAHWVLPYLGDTLDVDAIDPQLFEATDQRSRIGQTFAYRRHKGIAPVVGRVLADTTNWPALTVQPFEAIGWNQNVRHVRPGKGGTISVEDDVKLLSSGTPFDTLTHTVGISSTQPAATGSGSGPSSTGLSSSGPSSLGPGPWAGVANPFGLGTLAIYFWRLKPWSLFGVDARKVYEGPLITGYTFNPLGVDSPLFLAEGDLPPIAESLQPTDLPIAISRGWLALWVQAAGFDPDDGRIRRPFTAPQPQRVARICIQPSTGCKLEPVPVQRWIVSDLTDWRPPALPASGPPWVAIDPELGRLAFAAGVSPGRVLVDFTYARLGDVGAGGGGLSPQVTGSSAQAAEPIQSWNGRVSQQAVPISGSGHTYRSLDEALAAFEQACEDASPSPCWGRIEIDDSSTYYPAEHLAGPSAQGQVSGRPTDTWRITLPHGSRLTLATGRGASPTLIGGMSVLADRPECGLTLSGLRIEGILCVRSSLDLQLDHCTLLAPPRRSQVTADGADPDGGDPDGVVSEEIPQACLKVACRRRVIEADISLYRCICGPLRIDESAGCLRLVECLVDAGGDRNWAIRGCDGRHPKTADGPTLETRRGHSDPSAKGPDPGPPTFMKGCTIFGRVRAQMLEAVDTLLTGRAVIVRRQEGAMSYCYVPPGSGTPRLYRCQPSLAVEGLPAKDVERLAPQVRRRLVPIFVSRVYGQPGFGQLAQATAEQIKRGAETGTEIGVFGFLAEPQRRDALPNLFAEYAPWGLDGGFFYAT